MSATPDPRRFDVRDGCRLTVTSVTVTPEAGVTAVTCGQSDGRHDQTVRSGVPGDMKRLEGKPYANRRNGPQVMAYVE